MQDELGLFIQMSAAGRDIIAARKPALQGRIGKCGTDRVCIGVLVTDHKDGPGLRILYAFSSHGIPPCGSIPDGRLSIGFTIAIILS